MSFSVTVKDEITKIKIENKCCKNTFIDTIVEISSINFDTEKDVKISTENIGFATLLASLFKECYKFMPKIELVKKKNLVKNKTYSLIINQQLREKLILRDATRKKLYNIQDEKIDISSIILNCCRRTFIKACFLASGSINNPDSSYHLEIHSQNAVFIKIIRNVINYFGLNSKIIERKNIFTVYLKEGEDIVDFLNIIGAHSSLMHIENIRIIKEMRNNVNRVVNCETANIGKTVNAAVRHIEDIKYIDNKMGINKLQQNLREVAEVRLKFRDANLQELGNKLNPPLSKSGVNHRLKNLAEIANQLRTREIDDDS